MMRSDVFLSLKDTTKAVILDRVVKGEMTAAEGAARLKMSKRHVFRMKAKIRESDMSALAHGNRCRKPSNALPEKTRALVRDKGMGEYQGASLSHMEELFEKNDGLSISSKSIGRILKEAGATNPHARKSPKKFRRRKRRERFGSLIQVDASPFDWLENGEMLSLHGAIDDATGTVLSLRFEKNECSAGYLHILEETLRSSRVALLGSSQHLLLSQRGKVERGGHRRRKESPSYAVRKNTGYAGNRTHPGPYAAGEGTDRAVVGNAAEPPHGRDAHLRNKDAGGGEPFSAAVHGTA